MYSLNRWGGVVGKRGHAGGAGAGDRSCRQPCNEEVQVITEMKYIRKRELGLVDVVKKERRKKKKKKQAKRKRKKRKKKPGIGTGVSGQATTPQPLAWVEYERVKYSTTNFTEYTVQDKQPSDIRISTSPLRSIIATECMCWLVRQGSHQ